MAPTAREKVLENKIDVLEQRLVLVERFVEMRFCETFRDFTTRNQSRVKDKPIQASRLNVDARGIVSEGEIIDCEDDLQTSPDHKEEESTTTYYTRSGRKCKRPSFDANARSPPSSSSVGGGLESKRVLKVYVTRVEDNEIGRQDDEVGKVELANVNEDDDDGEYFTFPGGLDGAGEEEGTSENGEGIEDDAGMEECNGSDSEGDPNDSKDEDWNASEDEEAPSPSAKQKANTFKTKRPSNPHRKRKKYDVPSRQDLIPVGSLQARDPDLKECPICHKHWKAEAYDTHVATHVRERHLSCSTCGKAFFRKQHLLQHQKLHQMEKYGRKCRLCATIFANSTKVLYHERICIRKLLEADKPVDPAILEDVKRRSKGVDLKWSDSEEKIPKGCRKCVHCKKFVKVEQWKDHLREKHSNWKCSFCDRTFVNKSGLIRHLCRTHGKNCVTCEACEKTFESREAIRSHNAKCKEEHPKKWREVSSKNEKVGVSEKSSSVDTVGQDDGEDGNSSTRELSKDPAEMMEDN